MSRVLLFVQTGDGRPKRIATLTRARAIFYRDVGQEPDADESLLMLTGIQSAIQQAADRWWLVECENADEGREHIDSDRRRGGGGSPLYRGRILASGGKEPSDA